MVLKNIPTQISGRPGKIPGGEGYSKRPNFKWKFEAKLEFQGGWGNQTKQKKICGSRDIFWKSISTCQQKYIIPQQNQMCQNLLMFQLVLPDILQHKTSHSEGTGRTVLLAV